MVNDVARNNKARVEMKKLGVRHTSAPFRSLAITMYTNFCEVILSKATKVLRHLF